MKKSTMMLTDVIQAPDFAQAYLPNYVLFLGCCELELQNMVKQRVQKMLMRYLAYMGGRAATYGRSVEQQLLKNVGDTTALVCFENQVEALEKIEFPKVNWNSITPITDKGSPYANFRMERWIIVFVSDYASDSLRKLVKIKGWQVLTIGNSKTPSDWSLKGAIFHPFSPQLFFSISFLVSFSCSNQKEVAEELFTSLSVVGERLDSTRLRSLFPSLSVVGEMLDSTRCCCLVAVRFAFSRRRKARLHSLLLSDWVDGPLYSGSLYQIICQMGSAKTDIMDILCIIMMEKKEVVYEPSTCSVQRRGAMGSARVLARQFNFILTALPAVIPPEVPPQTQKKSRTVTSTGSVPLSSVLASPNLSYLSYIIF
ncbi:hypothetical protein F8388_017533 [Cannabis sativa]|uniref:Uncharacterized protein n=1 Tax=Cannabis sativa TaxID=3483 RepID=A0A7J6G4Y2_CANSA|nr:hypothetical protein F8388_017533 [Cannabis sativa]